MRLTCVIGTALIMSAAGSASAAIYQWNWNRGDPGNYGLNDNGGRFESVAATFDTNTKRMNWSVTFSDAVTVGMYLAVNNGPNPKGHPGELALIYVDARDPGDVVLTAYGYNGQNSINSFNDGNGNVSGNQAPDVIKNVGERSSWVMNATRSDNAGKRTISFDIDATDINAHTPLYPDPNGDPWFGIGFMQKLGLWMHTFRQFDVSYGPAGEITNINRNGEGWFDGANFNTTLIPTPGAVVLAGLALIGTSRRRR